MATLRVAGIINSGCDHTTWCRFPQLLAEAGDEDEDDEATPAPAWLADLCRAAVTGPEGQGTGSAGVDAQMRCRRVLRRRIAHVFPGAVAASWVIMTVVNGVMAQSLVVRMEKNLRSRPQYSAVDLPHWLSWPLVIAAAVALAGSGEWEYVGRNATLVFATPYFLLGLAVVHTLAKRVTYTGALLMVFYLVIVTSLWATLVVAGIGVVEQWFGLRDRAQTLPSQTSYDEDN